MRAASHGAFRLLPGPLRRAARARPSPNAVFALSLAFLAFVLVALAWRMDSQRKALQRLPDGQRVVLLSHAVDELRQLCGAGRPAALQPHCRELAAFAAQFDECRGDCEALVRHELTPLPTR